MKSRLVAYGRIQKGRPDRCKLVLLDERLIPEADSGTIFSLQRWCRGFRPGPGAERGSLRSR